MDSITNHYFGLQKSPGLSSYPLYDNAHAPTGTHERCPHSCQKMSKAAQRLDDFLFGWINVSFYAACSVDDGLGKDTIS